jgi:hypothetical protein
MVRETNQESTMNRRIHLAIVTLMLFALPAIEPAKTRAGVREKPLHPLAPYAAAARATLMEARHLAYDANFRNDQAGLRAAIAAIEPLVKQPDVEAYAHYYLSWTYWSLVASQMEAKDVTAALESANRAVAHARAGVASRSGDTEFHTMLANALIAAGFLDRPRIDAIRAELSAARTRALALGPSNPRTVIMDAGLLYWTPAERGGGRDKGMARWEAASPLFEREANDAAVDPMAPRWGQALHHGWAASMYLTMSPPQKERARRAADAALAMRPDFWYVRARILPQLRE